MPGRVATAYRLVVETRGRPSRRKLQLLVGAIIVVFAAGLTAFAFAAPLATNHPLLLITLDSRNRYLILAREVDVVPFFVIGVLRRVATDPLYWLLGYWYGERAIRWLETKGGWGPLAPMVEKVFAKAAYPMVFLFPGQIVCALAGATGMPIWAFLAVNVSGTITMVTVLRITGDVFGGSVDAVLGFMGRHALVITIVTLSLAVLSLVLNRVTSEIPSVDELEPDAEGAQGAEAAHDPED